LRDRKERSRYHRERRGTGKVRRRGLDSVGGGEGQEMRVGN